jgi:DNA polymerase-3 subunit beta
LLVEGSELRAVATDGHRLAYASMPLEDTAGALVEEGATRQELILPRKTVIELSRLLADSDEPLSIEICRRRFASSSARSIWCRS